MKNQKALEALSKKLGYEFQNWQILQQALTHRSVQAKNNERLEFLGDAIVNFLMAEYLFQKQKHAKEGELSRLRASLVKGDTLAELARHFQLGDYLILGSGELKTGGRRRDSILADAMEAVIAAIYLDAGIAECKTRVIHWYEQYIETLHQAQSEKDPKTLLQEHLQAESYELPEYEVVEVTGEAHAQTFKIACKITKANRYSEGIGSSRRKAEQAAAQNMLQDLKNNPIGKRK